MSDPASEPLSERARGESRPAVFLDRDGTIVREVDFLCDPDEVELLPGAARALIDLAAAGYALVVTTNQSGVARGYFDELQLGRIHDRMQELLAAEGAKVDLILYCPHHPQEGPDRYRVECACRKPEPGMLLEAAQRLNLDLGQSFTIGDSLRDLQAGAAFGVPGLLVATGKGADQYAGRSEEEQRAIVFVPDLRAAADRILGGG